MDHFAGVVEKNGGDHGLSRLRPLLLDHGVEAADGVLLQPCHRAAAVKDEYQFSQIFLHNNTSYNTVSLRTGARTGVAISRFTRELLTYTHIIGGFVLHMVNCEGTFSSLSFRPRSP